LPHLQEKGTAAPGGPVEFRVEDPEFPGAGLAVGPGGFFVVLVGGGFADDLDGDARRSVARLPEAKLLQRTATVEKRRMGDREEEVGVDADAGVGSVPAASEVAGDEGVEVKALDPPGEDLSEECKDLIVEGVLGHVVEVEEGAREGRREGRHDVLGHGERG
jgi:hypothetical protein